MTTSFFVPATNDAFGNEWEFDGNCADGTYFRSSVVNVAPSALLHQ